MQYLLAPSALATLDGVEVLFTSDEELGRPARGALVEQAARGLPTALVCEPSAAGGALKVARKGVSVYSIAGVGVAAHAELVRERGRNAILEMAHRCARSPRSHGPRWGRP